MKQLHEVREAIRRMRRRDTDAQRDIVDVLEYLLERTDAKRECPCNKCKDKDEL